MNYDARRDTEYRQAIAAGRITVAKAYDLGRSALAQAALALPASTDHVPALTLVALRFASDVVPWALNGGGRPQLEIVR